MAGYFREKPGAMRLSAVARVGPNNAIELHALADGIVGNSGPHSDRLPNAFYPAHIFRTMLGIQEGPLRANRVQRLTMQHAAPIHLASNLVASAGGGHS